MPPTWTRADFAEKFDVSRETIQRLDEFELLLRKWNPAINLVARSTLDDIWRRHIADSAQIWQYAQPGFDHWVDFGTGGGFPGLVVAILAAEHHPHGRVTMVESDQRKATFLRIVAAQLKLSANIFTERAEELQPQSADIVSARAVAPLKLLLKYAHRHLKPSGRALFMKGKSFRSEVAEALESWAFQSDEYTSTTDGSAVVLSLGDIRRV
ncbi:MAG: 16S rRNA (guanine(527)-N(7))-methyltransferase RsmG [Paracoccaceae bacterium]